MTAYIYRQLLSGGGAFSKTIENKTFSKKSSPYLYTLLDLSNWHWICSRVSYAASFYL
jgi:hypothetical protein